MYRARKLVNGNFASEESYLGEFETVQEVIDVLNGQEGDITTEIEYTNPDGETYPLTVSYGIINGKILKVRRRDGSYYPTTPDFAPFLED